MPQAFCFTLPVNSNAILRAYPVETPSCKGSMDRMSISLTPPPPELEATPQGRKRWTRDECLFLENAGLLRGHYELLDGEIIRKMSQGRRHALVVSLVFAYLIALFGARRVQTQATMEVRTEDQATNRPEPDLVVLRTDTDIIPTGREVLLAVEISDTTQTDDFGWKATLYARAGVEEYWVLDLPRRVLVVFRQPDGDRWNERLEFSAEGHIAPLAAPSSPVAVSTVFP